MGEATFGKYRLIAELGHGGMADVFLAVIAGPVGSGFTKLTVVKRLRPNLADEQEFVEMLVDEARISARLNHPNVVQTNEVGSVGNQYFLAMEYLDGQPLHRIQHRAMQKIARANADAVTNPPPAPGTPPPTNDAAALEADPFPKDCHYLVVHDTLAGLHHAHELADYDGTPLGIVHRDVTPHNVFVTYEGQVKVVDFGIAKAAGRASETRAGVVKGKVRYMAPEQAVGQPVDRRADLFSVGIMLWEAATGRRFWKDMDDLTIVQALVAGTTKTSPREVDPTIPEAIDRICRKALAFNRDERYATAEDFRIELEEYLSSRGMLTTARRRLSQGVSELFKDKRVEIKRVIEKQLAKLSATQSQVQQGGQNGSTSDLKPVMIALESGASGTFSAQNPPSTSGAPATVAATTQDEGPTSITDAATELYAGKKKRPPPSRLPIFALAGALSLAVVVVAVTKGNLLKTAPVKTAAAEDFVHVSIVATPQNAIVTVDHSPLIPPSNAKVPRDKIKRVLRVEAPGFEAEEANVTFEKDLTMVFNLKPSAAVAGGTSPNAVTTTTSAAAPRTALKAQAPIDVRGNNPKQAPTAPTQQAATAAPSPTPHETPPTPPKKDKIQLDKDIWDNN